MIYKAVTQERAHRLLRLGIVPIIITTVTWLYCH